MDLENGSSAQIDVQTPSQAESVSSEQSNFSNTQDADSPQLTELEKLERFKFEGREFTPQELKKAVLFQSDYTKKAQQLAEEKRQYESQLKEYETYKSEEKFRLNLRADLEHVRKNPQDAAKFLEVYPESFHKELQQVLREFNSVQRADQNQQQQQVKTYEQLQQEQRLSKLEKFYSEQEVAKQSTAINQNIEKLTKQYPDAIPEMAIGRVYEAYNQLLAKDPNAQLTDQMWNDAFKGAELDFQKRLKSKYGDLVKKQTEANARGRDIDTGGAAPGRPAPKFKNLSEVTKYAAADMSRRARS